MRCQIYFAVILNSFVVAFDSSGCSYKSECVLLQDCPNIFKQIEMQNYPEICGFENDRVYICCLMLSEEQCEIYSRDLLSFRIIGGEAAKPNEFPHMAALGYGDGDSKQWHCGGSLISEKFVLTAAHCKISREFGPVKWVKLGAVNVTTQTAADIQEIKVHRWIPHPSYKAPSVYNDIALIELERSLVFTPNIRPACLHRQGFPIFTVVATGWGLNQSDGTTSDRLQKVTLDYYNASLCNAFYTLFKGRRLENGVLDVSQICYGSQTGSRDTCQGDSGGPLQTRREGSILYNVVGVTSNGISCGSKIPAIYTRVSYFANWIESIVW